MTNLDGSALDLDARKNLASNGKLHCAVRETIAKAWPGADRRHAEGRAAPQPALPFRRRVTSIRRPSPWRIAISHRSNGELQTRRSGRGLPRPALLGGDVQQAQRLHLDANLLLVGPSRGSTVLEIKCPIKSEPFLFVWNYARWDILSG